MNSEDTNYETFRDCVFSVVADKLTSTERKPKKSRHNRSKSQVKDRASGNDEPNASDPAELTDFSDFLADELFRDLPDDLKTISYQTLKEDARLSDMWSLPITLSALDEATANISPSVTDSLKSYNLVKPPESDLNTFLNLVLSSYISIQSTAPPPPSTTRLTNCEICDRDWVPLTYHHLIPKQVHGKALKRGWHDENQLNNVAWLCRACHSFVHKMASNEELAQQWFTVESIMTRDDAQRWAAWVGKVRWRKR